MNTQRDQSTKNYNYTSRYATVMYAYDEIKDRYVYETGKHLSLNTEYVIHKIEDNDTLNSLAFKYYGRPDLYWVIADFNRIQDPFIKLSDVYRNLYVPALLDISFEG